MTRRRLVCCVASAQSASPVAPSTTLVGEAARINECVLLTRDMRAKRTYDLLGVSYELIGLD